MNINIPFFSVSYPIGSNMDNVKRLIAVYVEGFKQLGLPDSAKLNLWCRGSSGSILATAFSFNVSNRCMVCHVKKAGESSHSHWAEYFSDGVNIIIDDFVSSGATIQAIYDHMRNERNVQPSILIVATGGDRLTHLGFTHVINCDNPL